MKIQDAVAVQLFSAAKCNLQCTYCSVPRHNEHINAKHRAIIEEVKQVEPIIDRIKTLYHPDKVLTFSHWGTEPSLTIKYFGPFYERVIKEFPNFNCITFSSNFLSNTKDVTDFIKSFPKTDTPISFEIQLSLDGPAWITDANRLGGATARIIDNMIYFMEQLNEGELYHNVRTHFKPTVTKEQVTTLIEDGRLQEYMSFFSDVCDKLTRANSRGNVQMLHNTSPTVVCPDDYTRQDGKNFYQLLKCMDEIQYEHDIHIHGVAGSSTNSYYAHFQRMLAFNDEFFTKHVMFKCSAGGSNWSIDDYIGPCHDTMYANIDTGSAKEDGRLNSHNRIENERTGRQAFAGKALTRKFGDLTPSSLQHYLYTVKSWHSFTRFKLSSGVAIIKLMAKAGQISPCYTNDDMALLLAMYANSRHSCLVQDAYYTGSKEVMHPAFYKLFGNGALEYFIRKEWGNNDI